VTLDLLSRFLLWSLLTNYAILMAWFLLFLFCHDWMRRLHRKWFAMSDEGFDAIHYGAMAIYEIGIFLFNLVPLIALHLARAHG
jgi:hypothetical protein